MEPESRAALIGFWSLLDQLLNTMLFLLIGLQLLGLIIQPAALLPIAFAVPLAIASRGISVAAPLLLTGESLRDKARDTAVLTWAGLRGGISIALALTLAYRSARGHLRRRDFHDRGAGTDDAPIPARGVCDQKAQLSLTATACHDRNNRVY